MSPARSPSKCARSAARPRATAGALALAVLAASPHAAAHGVGMSQLRLRVEGSRVEGTWEVQAADAEAALGLGSAPDWTAARDAIAAHEGELREYLAGKLALRSEAQECPLEVTSVPLEWQPAQNQAVLRFGARCPSEPAHLTVTSDLLLDRDPAHRAYYAVEDDRAVHIGVFRADRRAVTIDIRHAHLWRTFVEFAHDGVLHVWSGIDHMLFLVALLLPAPLIREGRGWLPGPGMRRSLREVVKVVTAFTVAHSLTLGLAVYGVLTPPARWVEVGIALSVFVAAWNNLRSFLPGRAWTIAFAFGLVHGLGFAGALRDLGLPRHARGLALASFNVGVELGQLAIVLLVVPALALLARRRWYPRAVMGGASLMVAWLAALWVIERGLGVTLLGLG
jgi:hypothetical protein